MEVILTKDAVEKVVHSEDYLRSKGFPNVRVRYYNDLAKIEIPEEQLKDLFKIRDEVVNTLKKYGFLFVTLDLNGFKSGNMNKELSQKQIEKYQGY